MELIRHNPANPYDIRLVPIVENLVGLIVAASTEADTVASNQRLLAYGLEMVAL